MSRDNALRSCSATTSRITCRLSMRFGRTRPTQRRCSYGRRWASSDDVAMVSTPDPAANEAILPRGRIELAWAVLRRNPAYLEASADMPVLPLTGVATVTHVDAAWGRPF